MPHRSHLWRQWERMTYLLCHQAFVTLKSAADMLAAQGASSWRIRNKLAQIAQLAREMQPQSEEQPYDQDA